MCHTNLKKHKDMVDYTEETENTETETNPVTNETENNSETNETETVMPITSDEKADEIPKPGETGKKNLKKYK